MCRDKRIKISGFSLNTSIFDSSKGVERVGDTARKSSAVSDLTVAISKGRIKDSTPILHTLSSSSLSKGYSAYFSLLALLLTSPGYLCVLWPNISFYRALVTPSSGNRRSGL